MPGAVGCHVRTAARVTSRVVVPSAVHLVVELNRGPDLGRRRTWRPTCSPPTAPHENLAVLLAAANGVSPNVDRLGVEDNLLLAARIPVDLIA